MRRIQDSIRLLYKLNSRSNLMHDMIEGLECTIVVIRYKIPGMFQLTSYLVRPGNLTFL